MSVEAATKGESFKAEYFDQLFQLESDSFWFRARNRLVVWALRKYFAQAQNFLEIGCGTGFVLSGIQKDCPHLELFGSELFNEGLEFARSRLPGVSLIQLDAREMPYEKAFDVIGAFDVLEHIEEDELVLRRIRQAVRETEGSGILLTVPQHRFLWSAFDEYAKHARRYSAKELHDKVYRAGFTVERMTSFVSLLLPAMLLSRFKQQKLEDFDPAGELGVSPNLNRILEHVMNVEATAIKSGVNLPAGGSLLLVAKVR